MVAPGRAVITRRGGELRKDPSSTRSSSASLKRAVLVVAVLNAAYFMTEFGVARAIGSVALFADSIDFLEDASLNLMVFVALGWNSLNRSRLGLGLAALLLVPGAATV